MGEGCNPRIVTSLQHRHGLLLVYLQSGADYIGFSKGATEWAFSFAIFFLGMSAAFLGNIVEKDIHKSSLIAAICFAAGMAGTGLFI